ncbi:hypothetical protein FC83_GL003038 [Agrilactobacillus composti DSM 18527 = JCM 14202]|uniref:Uncharacterized protein n=1 Tax=Agrilactobacillus composti DSM 18527 = JCM 14202 TaxID=1423734 RepID=A0A0R1Y2R3_9LACO|nr:hypothetical protein [Agrilactobacillus composti]KRM36285.1 hypothetical protein FC83_GL003038 [Agrilactobacillus composti DSM 18527 = JCM 14202]
MNNQHTCAVVIVHGQSEYAFVQSIKSKLRLKIEIFARNKGKSSIQINKLPDVFQNNIFRSKSALLKEYETIQHRKRELLDFRIFTIMDVDDVENRDVRRNYIDGFISNIGDYQLKPYIMPIYFIENFEDALRDINFPFVPKNNRDKSKYLKVFDPTIQQNADADTTTELAQRFAKSKRTNVDMFLDYCLNHRTQF